MENEKKIRVGVTGVGSLLGQGILRATKSSSLPLTTVGLCLDRYATGLYWCDESMYIPMAKEDGYLTALVEAITEARLDVLLMGTDAELEKVAANRAEIENSTGAKILISSPFVIELGDDKYKTAKFFEDAGCPSTSSVLPTSDAVVQSLIDKVGFPLIVKPRNGARSHGVVKVQSLEQLNEVVADTKGPVVQECVGEDDAEYTASGLCFGGECKAVIVMRRELKDGNTYRAFVVRDEYLEKTVREWTELVNPEGPINFQFRLDKRGVPKVFEINSRFSGTTPLRAKAGFNEVEMCLRYMLLGEEIIQPEIKDVMILRHWEETVVDAEDVLGGQ